MAMKRKGEEDEQRRWKRTRNRGMKRLRRGRGGKQAVLAMKGMDRGMYNMRKERKRGEGLGKLSIWTHQLGTTAVYSQLELSPFPLFPFPFFLSLLAFRSSFLVSLSVYHTLDTDLIPFLFVPSPLLYQYSKKLIDLSASFSTFYSLTFSGFCWFLSVVPSYWSSPPPLSHGTTVHHHQPQHTHTNQPIPCPS